MAYKYITKYDSPNYHGRGTNKPNKIIIHHWGDESTGAKFDGVVSWLCNPRAKVSAHYVLEAGKVACLVNCSDVAWHAGNANKGSVGIECNPRASKEDVDTLVELISNLYKTYGVLPIYGHKEFMATRCPGKYQGKLKEIKRRAEALAKGKPTPKPTGKSIETLAKEVVQGKWGNGRDRVNKLTKAGYSYKAVQDKVDELLGKNKKKVYHTVKSGETLWAIGKRYGVNHNTIAKNNGIKNAGLIRVGQKLFIK